MKDADIAMVHFFQYLGGPFGLEVDIEEDTSPKKDREYVKEDEKEDIEKDDNDYVEEDDKDDREDKLDVVGFTTSEFDVTTSPSSYLD